MHINIQKESGIISWIYQDVMYEKKYENIITAHFQEDEIYIKYIDEKYGEMNEYCDLRGNIKYAYNRAKGMVLTSSSQFVVENLLSIRYVLKHNLFVAQIGEKRTDSILYILNKNGEKILKIDAPYHYSFYSLVKRNDEVDVVCHGDEATTDEYGRNDWRFSINYFTGGLKKEALEY